jgi:hypothetical protein
MIDYLWLKNKDSAAGLLVSFAAVPVSYATGFFIRPDSGLDIAGINIRYVFVLSERDIMPVPPPVAPVEVDVIGVNMSLGSSTESRGGSRRAATPYPFTIQMTESIAANRKSQSLIPRRAIYCDWVTNSLGGDAGSDSPIYY